VIASGLVHDVYQRFINPHADEVRLRRVTYGVMLALGVVALLSNINPVQYLQALIVFCTSSGAASFLIPALMAAYWRRATAAGAIAAMLGGATTVLTLSAIGWRQNWLIEQGWLAPTPLIGQATSFRPYFLFGMEPVVWGLLVSLALGVGVSLCSRPPREELLTQMFE